MPYRHPPITWPATWLGLEEQYLLPAALSADPLQVVKRLFQTTTTTRD